MLERSFSKSAPNPCAAIVSASSATTKRTSPSDTCPPLTRSSSLPGVATTKSTGCCSFFACAAILEPPTTPTLENFACRDNPLATPSSCAASSRVGASTTARGRLGRAFIPRTNSSFFKRATRGRRKARDFPEPVSAQSSTLSPARETGSEALWMAVGVLMFMSLSARHSSTGRPICPKTEFCKIEVSSCHAASSAGTCTARGSSSGAGLL
mmetsp:Transcript_37104/g.59803  ORF Transcript_37104/g.59803 Transcript_37104/m.59803 type:complete len:211 (-) Transcript_37104:242-874(-)